MAFAVENALALQALRHGDHGAALQRFEAAERHVADASINDASVFYLNRGRLRLQRLELSMARRDFARCLTLTAARDRPRLGLQFRTAALITVAASTTDERAVTVMADYHRRLAAGEDSASALASATASGPYVPFVCFGSSWRADPGGVRSSSGGDGERPGSRPTLR